MVKVLATVLLLTSVPAVTPFAQTASASDLEWLSISPLPAVRLNVALTGSSVPLDVSGGTPPYTISVVDGSLPQGLTISGAALSGTPTQTGVSIFTLRVTDNVGATAERAFSLAVVRGKRNVALQAARNQHIVLGDLASRTQAKNTGTSSSTRPNPLTKGWVIGAGASAPYTITGVDSRTNQSYTVQTDQLYSSGSHAAWNKEGDERTLNGSWSWTSGNTTHLSRSALRLESSGSCTGGSSNSVWNSYCSVFGPEVWTEQFVADAGESLSFAWSAQGGGDHYESYAYLVRVPASGSPQVSDHTLLAYGRGASQGWTVASGVIPANGTYQFRFVNGSYDASGGFVLGARMYVDTAITVGSTQTITFPEIGAQTTASGVPNVLNLAGVVTASSGLTVTLTASGACTASGLSVTLTTAGTCTLTANQAGSDLFVPAASVTRSFGVTLKTAQAEVTATVAPSAVYGDTVMVTPGGGSGTGAYSVSLSASESCTLSGTTVTITQGTGACAVIATRAGDATYAQRSSVAVSISVSPRALTVTGVTAVSRAFVAGNTAVTLEGATLQGVLSGDSVGLSNATVGTAASDQPGTHAVTTAMTLTGPAATNYSITQPSGVTVKILALQAAVTLSVAQTSAVYGDTIAVTAAGGQGDGALSINLTQQDGCTLTGNTVTITSGSGNCALTATRAGDETYAPAQSAPVSISIAPRPVTAAGPTGVIKPFDGTTSVNLPSCSGFALSNVVDGDTLTLTCPTTGTAAAATVGTHAVTPVGTFALAGVDAPNYTLTQPTFTVTVTRAQAQIWFSGGLVQFVQSDGTGVGLPSVAANPPSAGTLLVDWHDASPPTKPGRYRVNLSLDSDTHQATPVATFVSVLAQQSLPQNMPAPALGPVTLRDDAGEPQTPVLAPSIVSVKRDDQPVNAIVTRPTLTQVKIEKDGGQSEILFAAKASRTADERPLAAESDLVLLAGGVLDVSGSGYKPGTTVEVWMFSEPELLGVTTVEPDGSFTDQFDVPASVAAGEHVIQLNGTTATNQLGSSSIGVLVEVPANTDDPAPLRIGTGRVLTASTRGPQGLVGNRVLDVTTRVSRSPDTRGRQRDTLTVSHDSDTTEFTVSLTPRANRTVAAIVDNSLVLSRAATVEGTIDGFAGFSSVYVWMLSQPRLLGRVLTNDQGNVKLRVSLPDDLAYGRHTLQFAGTGRTGEPLGIALTVWITADTSSFSDVTLTMSHGAAIATLAAHEAVNGFTDGTFRTNTAVTRGHAAAMLTKLFQREPSDVTDLFSDAASSVHVDAIAALATAHVIHGYADGTFKPHTAITRGQAALMLARLLQLDTSGPHTAQFTDVTGRHDAQAIAALHTAGLLTGFSNGSFRPDAPITRGQFATLIVHAQYHQALS